jgi:hypothetical protein
MCSPVIIYCCHKSSGSQMQLSRGECRSPWLPAAQNSFCQVYDVLNKKSPLEETGRNVNLKTQHNLTTKQMLNKRLIPPVNSHWWRLTECLVSISFCHFARCSPLLIHSAKAEMKCKARKLQVLLATRCEHARTEKSLEISYTGLHFPRKSYHDLGLRIS